MSAKSLWSLCWNVTTTLSVDVLLINTVRALKCHLMVLLAEKFSIFLQELILVVCIK